MKDTFNVTEQRKVLTRVWSKKLLSEVDKTKLVIDFHDNSKARTITAYYITKRGKVRYGIAKCRKGDEYDFTIGSAIAVARLMNIPLPWFIAE